MSDFQNKPPTSGGGSSISNANFANEHSYECILII